MDLTFNVLESIRRDIRELRDDLHLEKTSRHRQYEDLQKNVDNIKRDVRYIRQEVVAEHEARETSVENLRRELTEELRREVGAVRSDMDAQRKRIRVQEEEGFMTIDGTCISWGASDIAPGGAPAATDIDFPRKYRTPPAVFSGSRDHCSFVIGTGDNGHSRVRKDGFTASALSFAGVEATKKGCQMNWMAIGARVVDAERAESTQQSLAGRVPRLEQMSNADMEKLFRAIFRQADVDGNGVLDSKEFVNLLKNSGLGLSKQAIRRILEEADIDHDGFIDYREFVPVISDIIVTTNQIMDGIEEDDEKELLAYDAASKAVLDGMTEAQLVDAASMVFKAADISDTGVLSRKEFAECLQMLDLGFTMNEIKVIMASLDTNGDGKISFEEFLPGCIGMFIEMYKDKLLEDPGSMAIQELYSKLFAAADATGSGKLAVSEMTKILGSNGWTPMQVETVMGEAQVGADGSVAYGKFLRVLTQYHSFYFKGAPPTAKDFNQMNDEESEIFLSALFHQADADNNGVLDQHEFIKLLQGCGLGLTRTAIHKVIEEADVNADGVISYEEFIPTIIDIFNGAKIAAEARDTYAIEYELAKKMAEDMIFGEIPQEQILSDLLELFNAADVDHSGQLDSNEFLGCLKQLNLGLTKKEIKAIMADIDVNADGKVSYDEFIELGLEIYITVLTEKYLEGSSKLAYLMNYVIEEFAQCDGDGSGKVTPDQVEQILVERFCMPPVLIQVLMAEAVDMRDQSGQISYKKFARIVASVAFNHAGDDAPAQLAAAKRRAVATGLFKRIDKDASGVLEPHEMESFTRRLSAKFRLSLGEDVVSQIMSPFTTGGKNVSEADFVEVIVGTFGAVPDEQYFNFFDYMMSHSYYSREKRLRMFFWKLDTDGSGFLDMDEMRQQLKKVAMSMEASVTDEMITQSTVGFEYVDRNGDGKITEEEFITAFLEVFELFDDAQFLAALSAFDQRTETDRAIIFSNLFARSDLDNDGFLDRSEIAKYCQRLSARTGRPMSADDLPLPMGEAISKEMFIGFFMAQTEGTSDEEFEVLVDLFYA